MTQGDPGPGGGKPELIAELFDIHVMEFAADESATVAALQDVFPVDEATARAMVTSTPLVVKRACTPEAADEFIDALQGLGAQVVIMPCKAPPKPSAAPSPLSMPPRSDPPPAVTAAAGEGPRSPDALHVLAEALGRPPPDISGGYSIVTEPPPAPALHAELEFEEASESKPPALASSIPAPQVPAATATQVGNPAPHVSFFPEPDAQTQAPDAQRPAAPMAQILEPAPPRPPPPPPPPPPPRAAQPSAELMSDPSELGSASSALGGLPALQELEGASDELPSLDASSFGVTGGDYDDDDDDEGLGSLPPLPDLDLSTGPRSAPPNFGGTVDFREPDTAAPISVPRRLEPPVDSRPPGVRSGPPESIVRTAKKSVNLDLSERRPGVGLGQIALSSGVIYLGMWLDNSVLYGNAGPLWIGLNALAFFILGLGFASMRPS